jgi:hypothetical protein
MFYDPVPACGKELIGHYIIQRKAPEHDDHKVKLKIRLN